MASPLIRLPSLTPREAAADALHRCILGIDSNNRSLFASGCLQTPEMIVIANDIPLEGWTTINSFFDRVFSLVTTHIVTNIRVNLKDEKDDSATITAQAISYHVRPEDAFKEEDTSYTGGSLYDIEVVRDREQDVEGEIGGVWRIKRWGIKVLWTTGDKNVLHPEA